MDYWHEALMTGTWTSSKGQKLTIDEQYIDDIVANFQDRGEQIPIDVNHRLDEAAGWVRDMRRDGGKLLFMPEWNDLGRSLVAGRVYRFVSVSLAQDKSLVSISLTNFPAVKGLRPLSFSIDGTSYSFSAEEIMPEDTTKATVVDGKRPGAPVTPPAGGTKQPTADATVDFAAQIETLRTELTTAFAQQLASFQEQIKGAAGDLEQQRTTVMADLMQRWRDEQEIAAFSQTITSTGRHALPVTANAVADLLGELPAPYRGRVRKMMEDIASAGTVDFSEVGTSAEGTAKAALPRQYAPILDAFVKQGGSVASFFDLNADLLGPASRYDLAAFTTKPEDHNNG